MPYLVQLREQFANERLQYFILVGLSLGVVALTTIAYFSDHLLFRDFLGRINPILAIIVIVLLGGALLSLLLAKGWFLVYLTGNPIRFLWISGLAALMTPLIILVDFKVIFAEDLNVLFPRSLLFYPAVGYAAEILFHVLPLSILLIGLTSLSKNLSFEAIIWPCILIVSTLEAVFHTLDFAGKHPPWAVAFVGAHVLAINVIQLVLFKRYDFVSMYSFRLAYYFFWHIVWGYARMRVLF